MPYKQYCFISNIEFALMVNKIDDLEKENKILKEENERLNAKINNFNKALEEMRR